MSNAESESIIVTASGWTNNGFVFVCKLHIVLDV